MATARQKVLQYLHKARTASTPEISRALKMSPATVRHHLRLLAADGRLEIVSVRRRGAKGRPENVYSLPQAALGDNLAALSDALLDASGSQIALEQIATRLAGEARSGSDPLAKRLSQAIENLNRMKYHAHWEAGAEGPRVVFGHCPYLSILERHPGLCHMDRTLLEQLTNQPARQVFRTGKDGSTVCVFVLGR